MDNTDHYDEWRDDLVRREWDTEGAPPVCSECSVPVAWTGGGFLHVMPDMPRLTGLGEAEYMAAQMAWAVALGTWTWRTAGHRAVVS